MTGTSPNLHLYVWNERFLYVGPSKATTLHRNHAAVWLNAPEGKIRVRLANGLQLEDSIVYLPSDTEYATDEVAGSIAALFWEPESASFHRMADDFDNVPRAFHCEKTDLNAWQLLQNPATTLADAERLLAIVFGMKRTTTAELALIDARVKTAVTFLRESPHLYNSIEALAEMVHLSPSRFAHVFKTAVGVPVRRYVLWMKMRKALDLAIAGDSLTTAALSAGFADSVHLSRTVRAMMGIAPEYLFRHRERLVVHK